MLAIPATDNTQREYSFDSRLVRLFSLLITIIRFSRIRFVILFNLIEKEKERKTLKQIEIILVMPSA